MEIACNTVGYHRTMRGRGMVHKKTKIKLFETLPDPLRINIHVYIPSKFPHHTETTFLVQRLGYPWFKQIQFLSSKHGEHPGHRWKNVNINTWCSEGERKIHLAQTMKRQSHIDRLSPLQGLKSWSHQDSVLFLASTDWWNTSFQVSFLHNLDIFLSHHIMDGTTTSKDLFIPKMNSRPRLSLSSTNSCE